MNAILDIESIEWIAVTDALPDSETTVLVYAPAALDEPVWLGYHDGESWVSVTGAMYSTEDEITASVQAWAPMPRGPDLAAGKSL
jgi:hypothetical protein